MSSNSICNHTCDQLVNHAYDYRPHWTTLSPITITVADPDLELRGGGGERS